MIDYISSKKAAIVYLDSFGAIGIIIPATNEELKKTEFTKGFKCIIYSVEMQNLNGLSKSFLNIEFMLFQLYDICYMLYFTLFYYKANPHIANPLHRKRDRDSNEGQNNKRVKFDDAVVEAVVETVAETVVNDDSVRDHYNDNLTRNQVI